jgi:hypothetical protein
MMMTQPIAFKPGNSLIINCEHLVLRSLIRADATPTYAEADISRFDHSKKSISATKNTK